MALIWGWASDGPCHGVRWPFIYVGAAITVSSWILQAQLLILIYLSHANGVHQLLFSVLLRQMRLYENITGRMIVYWFSQIGVSVLVTDVGLQTGRLTCCCTRTAPDRLF